MEQRSHSGAGTTASAQRRRQTIRLRKQKSPPRHVHHQSIFSLKCFAFQTIRPVVLRKKRGFSAHFGPGGAVPPPRVSPFSKLKRFRHSVRVLGRMGEFEGETTGTPFLALLRKGWALFAASSDPTGGRRPCRQATQEPYGHRQQSKGVPSPSRQSQKLIGAAPSPKAPARPGAACPARARRPVCASRHAA